MTKDLKVMDSTAIAFCRDNKMPIVVFDMSSPVRCGRSWTASTSAPSFVTSDGDGYAGRVTEETFLEAIEKMEKAVEHVQSQFTTVRTGRATPALVEKLKVDYYGSTVPLQQLAAFQVPEARQLIVQAARPRLTRRDREGDPRQRPRRVAVERRCRDPSQLPPAHRRAPQGVRQDREAHGRGRTNCRPQPAPRCPQDLEAAEKAGVISADELERAEKEIEKITHEHVDLIDRAFGRKEHELLEV